MLVENLMTPDPESCRPDSTLAEAAAVMWRRDCGVVPVTEEGGRVLGVVTDRDICMALSMRGQRAADVRVSEVMAAGAVETCTPVDDVREALETMKRGQVRRLPVVDSRGRLVGILSINDVIRHTRKGKGKRRVSRRDTLSALKAICRPHGSAEATDEEDAPGEHYDEAPPAQAPEAARTEKAEGAEVGDDDKGARKGKVEGEGKRARAKGTRKGARKSTSKSTRRKKSTRGKDSEAEGAGGGGEPSAVGGAGASGEATDAGSGGE